MNRKLSRKHFSLIAFSCVTIAVIALGAISYEYLSPSQTTSVSDYDQPPISDDVPQPPEVTNKDDLDAAVTTLDSVNISNEKDSEQLNWQLDSF